MNSSKPLNLRVQDIVARTSHVNLKDTVRVLRALSAVVSAVYCENVLAKELHNILSGSAHTGSRPSPLHSKPDSYASSACDEAHDVMVNTYGQEALDSVYDMTNDPYYTYGDAEEEVEYTGDTIGNH